MWRFEIARAAVTCPSLFGRCVKIGLVQRTAGIGFEIVQDSLWFDFCFNYCVYVRASHVEGVQVPFAILRDLLNCGEYGFAALMVKMVGGFDPSGAFQRLRVGNVR